MRGRTAIVIGHNSAKKGQFSSVLQQQEYEFNRDVAHLINKLDDDIDIYSRKDKGSYCAEMGEVIGELNKRDYDLVLELHFNSMPDMSITGSEVLCWHNSKIGVKEAKRFLDLLCEKYEMRNRGLVPITSSKQRGGYGIGKTRAPYLLIEPFFGSNPEDAEKFKDKYEYAEFIVQYLHGVKTKEEYK